MYISSCCSDSSILSVHSRSAKLSVSPLCLHIICMLKQEGGNASQPSATGTWTAKEAEAHPHRRSGVLIRGSEESQVSATQPDLWTGCTTKHS